MKGKSERETKILPSQTLGLDAETGVVEAYVSVMGILDDDDPPDMIPNGAFLKTINERGPAGANRIRTLWQHDWTEVIGKPIQLAEHPRDALPQKILDKFPTATGGLYAKTQFILDVQRGREAVALYRAGAMDEWSIGFDAVAAEWNKENDKSFRLLGEIRLWEYSPVTWGANPGTTTTSVKNSDQGSEVARRLAALLGMDADLNEEELLAEVEKRLRNESSNAGAGPSGQTLTPREVAQLKAKLLDIQIRINGGA